MRGVRTDIVVVVVVVLVAYALYPAALAAFPAQSAVERGGNTTSTAAAELAPNNAVALQFRNATERSGFDYEYAHQYNGTQSVMSNAGVYTNDYNGDGWTDLLAIGGERPVLFENRDGHFEPSAALPTLNRSFRAALFVDYDNDGWEDLLLLPMNAEPVFLANHQGRFVRRDVGLNVTLSVPTGASAGDIDGNGCPDLFITQNGNWSDTRPAGLRNYSAAENGDNGGKNYLFIGNCSSFEAATEDAGITGERWSLASSVVDLTGDGAPEIHVANDFGHDALYRNRGDGTFEKVRLGNRTNRNGMSSEVADLTGDGRLDVFVTNVFFPTVLDDAVDTTMEIRSAGNNLLVNEDNGTLDEAAAVYGVRAGGWGWAAIAADLTNDGHVDLFHTTRDINLEKYRQTLRDQEVRYLQTQFSFYDYPVVWSGTNRGFVRLDPAERGFEATNGRGAVQLDYDRDGRLDVAVADAGGTYALYQNVGAEGNAVQVAVRGTESVSSLGARVVVETPNGTRVQARTSKSDFLSQDSRVLHFGTGNRTRTDVTVTWADGNRRVFEDVRTGQRITVAPTGIVDSMPFNRTAGPDQSDQPNE